MCLLNVTYLGHVFLPHSVVINDGSWVILADDAASLLLDSQGCVPGIIYVPGN